MVRAVVMHPVQKRLNKMFGFVDHSLQGNESGTPTSEDWNPARAVSMLLLTKKGSKTPMVHRPYATEEIKIAINCAAVIRGASWGKRCMACSILQNPSPKVKG
mmetsp:Transcript_12604/g.31755  ORF Transcript_12604/g.31755 Transcript_12604/m.31755 type:complete len:103 (+) Transcript_12604:541-849(+)